MTGIFIFITVAIIAGLIFLANKNRRFIFSKDSIEADAIILNLHLIEASVKNGLQAILQLQVQPDRGRNFICHTKEMLSVFEYTKIEPGKKIRVRYNPGNNREVFILRNSL